MSENQELFDKHYFAHGCGRPYQRDQAWLNFFNGIAEQIVKRIDPGTVLDAGCALGFLVEGLRKKGVQAFGIDISEYAINNVHSDVAQFCSTATITEPFPQRYDLIVVIEVLEHLKPENAINAIENICNYSNDILFSSTPFDYKEATHFNVQPPEYWAELFALQGFYRDLDFDATFITPWAARFVRKRLTPARLVRDYERRHFQLAKQNIDLRELVLENQEKLKEFESRLEIKEDQLSKKEEQAAELEEKISRLEFEA
jgi:SAM-dependent methyltransferase